jgi:hypothetical protein
MESILGQLASIEGKASDVRVTRAPIVLNGRYGALWDNLWGSSYECVFRLSNAPVALRVSGPVFIKDGETVRVVGWCNLNGVFDAVAYYNRTSGVSGKSEWVWSRHHRAMFNAVAGLLLVFFVVFFVVLSGVLDIRSDPGDAPIVRIGVGLFGGLGLALMLYGLTLFVRYRREIYMIERLLIGD